MDDPEAAATDVSTLALTGVPLMVAASDAPIILDGKYRLDERLGEGDTGVVYSALHVSVRKCSAVKLLTSGYSDPLARARVQREPEAVGQLRHPHVVEVADFG